MRLLVELLEARLAPASIFWNVDASGSWDVASNWTDEFAVSRVPAAGDDVFLDRPVGTFTVTHGQGDDSVQSLHASRSGFVLSGGSLAVSAASELGGDFTLSGGNLIPADGIMITTAGNTTWSGGSIFGGGLPPGGVAGTGGLVNTGRLTLTGPETKLFTGVLTNAGTFIHAATGDLQVGFVDSGDQVHPGTLNNVSSGVYDFQADGHITNGFGGAPVNNAGIIRKSAGTGVSGIGANGNADVKFTNTGGAFDIRSGTFTDFIGGVFTGGGTFTASAGATLVFGGNSSQPTTMSGALTGSGPGTIQFSARSLIIGAAGATFNFTPGLFQWTAIGQSTTSGADLTNLGSITLAGTGIEEIANALNNAGTILHAGLGSLYLSSGGTLTNQVGGVYDLQADQSTVDTGGTFINRGTLRKSGGTGTSTLSTHLFRNEGGAIDVQHGILALDFYSGNSTGGTFTVAKDAVLDLTSQGTPVYTGTYTGAGEGIVRLRLAGFFEYGFGLNVAGATFNFPAGMFQWLGGTLNAGTTGFDNTGFLTLAGADAKGLSGVLNNAGTIAHAGTSDLNFATANTVLNNLPGGLYDLQGDVNFSGNGSGYSTFSNAGTLRKSAGTSVSSTIFGADFVNTGGTIDVQSGSFAMKGFTNPALAHTGGTFHVAAGAQLDLNGDTRSREVFQGIYSGSGEGVVLLDGGTVAAGAGGAVFDFPPGLLQWTGGTLDGTTDPVTNRGTITLPSAFGAPLFFGALNNAGTIISAGAALLFRGDGHVGVFTNLPDGLFEFQGDGGLVAPQPGNSSDTTFINQGTLRQSGPGAARVFVRTFSNTGTVAAEAGTLRIESLTVTQIVAGTLTAGTWQVAANSSLVVSAVTGGAITTNNARVILDGPGARFPQIEEIVSNTGQLTLTNGANLSITRNTVARSFDTGLGSPSLVAIALDPTTGNVLVYNRLESQIRRYTPAGAEVLPRIPLPGGASSGLDMEITTAPLTVGSTTVPAGNLLVLNGSLNTVYAANKDTGAVLASVTLAGNGGDGGSYHYGRGRYFTFQPQDSNTVQEFDLATGAVVNTFSVRATNAPPWSNQLFGDLAVDPETGNLLVAGEANGVIREMTPTGQWVRDIALPSGVGQLGGMDVDAATGHVWVCSTTGRVFELGGTFTNGGSLTVGPGSTLSVAGPFTQTAAGTLHAQLGGDPAGGQFGRVVSTGPAALAGTFDVALVNGFGPTAGQSFPVMSFAGHGGAFDTITGLKFGRFPLFTAQLNADSVTLTSETSTADLAFDKFDTATFPTTAALGQNVTITYTVQNLSDTPATGDWYDSVYLSRDGTLDPGDALLGRVHHMGDVAGLAGYTETLTAPLPALADGGYHVLVLADSRGLVPDPDRPNNTGVSTAAIAVTVPALALGTPLTGTIASGQDLYYGLVVAPGQDVTITADFTVPQAVDFYLRYRDLPDRSNFDQSATSGALHPRLMLSNPQGGSYYILLHGREGAAGGTSFTLKAEPSGFAIVSFSPSKGSNKGGQITMSLVGSKFTPQTVVSLRAPGGAIPASAIQFVDANHLTATFDLTGHATGAYQVRADDAGQTAVALDTFSVNDSARGAASILIISPATVFVGAGIGVKLTILNSGGTDTIAPLIVVTASNVAPGQETNQVLGSGLDALPGVLPPGKKEVPLGYTPVPAAAGVTSNFQTSVVNPSDTFVDWDSQKASLRPSTIPADAWDAIWPNFRSVVGNTLADLYALLKEDAKALAQVGVYTNAVDELTEFELNKANNQPSLPAPAPAADLAFPAPGLPLVFGRSFRQTIAQRYHLGRLGRGWADNFDISAAADPSTGFVTIRRGDSQRFFFREPDGTYVGTPGDTATLTRAGGAFRLREANGAVTAFRADGLLDYLQDTNNNRLTAGYTGGQLTSVTHSDGSALTFHYNVQGRIDQVTDPAGGVSTYAYDASGEELLSVTTPAGTAGYTYTPEADGPRAHAVASISYPDGTHQFFDYDSRGRLARQQRDGGTEALTFVYGLASYRVTDALGNSTTVSFDDSFQTAATQDPLGRLAQMGYDANHHLTGTVSTGSAPATLGYDARGNPAHVVDPQGQSQDFNYETSFNHLATWQDALGNPTAFTYDANGNLVSTTYADGTTAQLGYDAHGNAVRSVNRRGQVVSYTYDDRGLLTRKDLPDGSHVDYHFNARGNLDLATDATGSTALEYLDPQNPDLVTQISYPSGQFLQYTYENGRRTRMVDQSGFAVNYHYDAVGRLDFVRDGGGNLIAGYHYDAAGRLDQEDKGDGTSTTYQYDSAGQLKHLVNFAPGGAVLSRFDYTYDVLGRRDSMTTLEGKTTYGYDATGRLTSVTLPGGRTITYGYDAAGNRTVVKDGGVTTAYKVNNLNEYVAIGATSQAFDADGNLAAAAGPAGNTSYVYDAEGRLLRVTTPAGTWAYEYDALGNRVASTHDGVRTQYLVDPSGLGDVVGEYDGAGTLVAHYTQGLGLTSRVDAGGQAAYYQFDAAGNTAQLTGPGGTVLNTYSYLPFGEALKVSETVPNPYQFVGQLGVTREGNGLDFMRNRWYDAAQGRFTQQDPIGLAGGPNLYAYVGNNPVTLSDPSGLNPSFIGLLIEGIFLTTPGLGGVPEAFGATLPGSAEAATDLFFRNAQAANEARQAAWMAEQGLVNSTGSAGINANPLGNSVGGPGGISEQAFRAGQAQLERTLAQRAAVRAVGRFGAYAFIAAGVAVIGFEAFYLGEQLGGGDDPECVSYVPLALQPGCKFPQLTTGLLGPRTSTTQIDPPRLSKDPNDIVGPAGFGADGFVDPQAPLAYQINFQNKPEALGPAEQVVVTHKLDPNLDLDTFELGDFGFGDLTVTVPSGRQFYSTRLDLRSTRGVFVDVTAELDRATRTATWTFQALDPTTMDLPIDPLVGFLPPDQTAPEGEGFVSFSVGPEADLPTGTRIDARATVVFDTNAPLDTNVFTNALDGGPPASSVNALPASTPATSFTVSWSGSDEGGLGSGIASYDVFVSVDGGPFTPFLLATTQTSATFTGADRHTYGFYSVATDNLGHREATPTGAQATTRVSLGIAPTLTSAGGATFTVGTAGRFTVTTSPSDPAAVALRESGALPAGVTFTDNGDGTATLAGTPTAGGAFSFVITAANGIAPDAAQTFVLTVNPPAITLTPALSSARVGVAYRQTITAGGGTAPYGQFVITSGGLPAGLSLDSATGVLSGTPTAGGTFGFTVRATDASTGTGPFTGSRSYALTVAPPSLVIDPAPPAPARVGVAFSQAVSARGGTAPYHFRLAGGSLPPGVALDPGTGILGGIPRTPGTFRFVVRVTDSSTGTGPFGSGRALTLAVGQGSPARLVFLTQVGSAALNGQLPTFRVLVLDQFGNRVSGVVVRLALVPVMAVGPAGFGAGSVVQATAADGVATFGHVTVRTRGRYRLRAFAGLGGALSNPFDVGLNGRQG